MFESIMGWFVVRPARLVGLGQTISTVCGGLLMAAIWQAVLLGVLTRAGATTAMPAASLLPGLISWAVPDGPFMFSLAALGIGMGIVAMLFGHDLQRQLGDR